MKTRIHIWVCALLLSGFGHAGAQSDSRSWIAAGITYGGWLDKGYKDNTFDLRPGYKFEFAQKFDNAFGIVWYSYGGYNSTNHVGESAVPTRFHHHLWELRYYLVDDKIDVYGSFGMGFGAMRLRGMEGKDRYLMIPVGAGLQYAFKKLQFEVFVKPYWARGNQLYHRFGFESGLMVGYLLSD